MAAPIFLTIDEFFTVLFAELPAGVYAPDDATDPDPAKRSVSSSELRAISQMFADASGNLELVYEDKFLSTVTSDGLLLWEKDYFDSAQDSSLPLETRRQNLISKIRSTGGISYPAIYSLIQGILGAIPFDLLPYSGQKNGAWLLGRSSLDQNTWLAKLDPLNGARQDIGFSPLDCSLDYASDGLTADQLTAIQSTAYEYEVRIYGQASQATLNLLDARLTQFEPARSTHVIRNNQVQASADFTAYRAATPEYEKLRLPA